MHTELFVGAFCGVATIGAFCYHRRRRKSPVKVNCWFCNRDSQVHYGNKNCWDCPYCDQYNGFDQDGGYNKPIPAQHDDSLNHSAEALIPATSPKTILPETNGLCDKCNENQQLKIAQLAHFIPKNQDQEDMELAAYVHQLDCEYRLCNSCQIILRQTLSRQDAVLKPNLLGWQMSQKRRCSALQERRDNRPNKTSTFICILQLVSLCSALALCFGSLCQPEVRKIHWLMDGYLAQRSNSVVNLTEKWGMVVGAVGFCCIVVAILGAGKHVLRIIDAADCFVWLLLFLVHATPVDDQVTKSGLEKKALRMVVSAVCVVVTIGCVSVKRRPDRNRRSWKGCGGSSSASSSYLGPSSFTTDCSSLSGRTFTTCASPTTMSPSHYDLLQDNEVTTSSPPPPVPLVDALFLDSGIKAMKIGTPQKSPLTGGVFGVPRPILPLRLDLAAVGKRRRPLVSPSRFRHKTITQSSWVAGGLWSRHAGHRSNAFYLPGVTVSCPVSRAESEAGDDRFSVLSEPARTGTLRDQWDHRALEDTMAQRRSKSDLNDLVSGKDERATDKVERKQAAIGSSKWSWIFYILTGLSLAFNIHLVTRMFHKS